MLKIREQPEKQEGRVLSKPELLRLFRYKAEQAAAQVHHLPNVEAALSFAVEICNQKETCRLLAAGCEADLSPDARDLCDSRPAKVIAAPDLDQRHYRFLQTQCEANGHTAVSKRLRPYVGGIDIGITWAQFGIAETGTLVIDSTDEDLRLATMISEIHIALLPSESIVESATDIEEQLQVMMQAGGNYAAMITGPSRTADIERVLALGVHGPLQLYVLTIGNDHVRPQ
jgi:L-lactate dehydrogenase complex protein LldG